MDRITSQLLSRFQLATGTNPEIANKFLREAKGNIQQAILSYFSSLKKNPTPPPVQESIAEYLQFFTELSKNKDEINFDDLLDICQTLQVDPKDPVLLHLHYLCGATQLGTIQKNEFIKGFQKEKIHNWNSFKEKVAFYKENLYQKATLRPLYLYTFQISLEPGQHFLPYELAIDYWDLLLSPWCLLTSDWVSFCRSHLKKNVSQDTWKWTLEFFLKTNPDFSNIDANDVWPVLVDDFIEWKGKSM